MAKSAQYAASAASAHLSASASAVESLSAAAASNTDAWLESVDMCAASLRASSSLLCGPSSESC